MLRTINTIPQIIIHEDDYRVTEGGENLYRIESSVKGYDIGDNVYASMTVMIDTFIKIEDDVEIYPYVQIRDSCWICNNVKIYSFVHIGENVCIDDDVIIGPETWISDYSHIGNMSYSFGLIPIVSSRDVIISLSKYPSTKNVTILACGFAR